MGSESERRRHGVSPRAHAAIVRLLEPRTIRERCGRILQAARAGDGVAFTIDDARLPEVVDRVVEVIGRHHPDLVIPLHSRWGHFQAGGTDRLGSLRTALAGRDADGRARALIDLVVTSVLLDAGAGPTWRYRETADAPPLSRSEGLAVASLDWFRSGGLSSDPGDRLRVDYDGLARIDAPALERAFQVDADNPLIGVEGRVALLHGLAQALLSSPVLLGNPPRPSGLLDHLRAQASEGRLPAREVLVAVLEAFGSIWPGRRAIEGVPLGDVWPHPAAGGKGPNGEPDTGLVPFHKLSQWLAYSLVEPLEEAGLSVVGLDELTALAEYRNGGLLIDLGVIVPRDPGVLQVDHEPGEVVVVEWRALTVALLDEVAQGVRDRLGLDASTLPMGKVLEGGTWRAGREVAAERRADGSPPLRLRSDGTVF